MKITCIYKITSPSGAVYVGQTRNLRSRWACYRSITFTRTKAQPILVRSFEKYGTRSHTFEIICELPDDIEQQDLDRQELAYYDCYRACVRMLNSRTPGPVMSTLDREKIARATKK